MKGTVNGFPFRSSLMNTGEGHMTCGANAQMRAGGKCKAGDIVKIVMELDQEERKVELPAYLKKIINSDAQVKQRWAKLSFTHQKEHVRAIEDAKREETRERRTAQMMEMLRQGQRKR